MSQNKERDRVIELIRKMMTRTSGNGCSNSEMEQSMAKIGQYMEQYDISMDEVEIRAGVCITHKVDSGVKKDGATLRLSMPIAALCGVRIWTNGGGKKRTDPNIQLNFFGYEPDVLMAEYLFTLIRDNMATETARYMAVEVGKGWLEPGKKKSMRVSFGYGYVETITRRLYQMKREREAALVAAGGSSSRDLVLVKAKIVEEQYAIKKSELRLRQKPAATYQRKNVGATFRAGEMRGEALDLSTHKGSLGRNKLMLE